MLKIQDTSTPVVVLRSDSHGGLNIMRSLGRLGVPVYNVDPNPWAPASCSRYCRRKFLWDIEHCSAQESLHFMCDVRRKIGRPSILFPTTDRTARFVADHSRTLSEWFIFPKLTARLASSLSSKRDMFYLARDNNIPTPEAAFPNSRDDVLSFLERARLPVMLKGIDGQQLWDRTGKKMFIVGSKDELLALYDVVEDRLNPNLMLQEYIPGGDDTVWMFNGYFNAHSECLVCFTGKKIRQCPIYTGSTSLGICLHNPAVEDLTLRFMKAIGYQGILDIGYRYDARDGQYKVLDANPRIGATFRLFVGENGIDVARALYLDMTGQDVVAVRARDGRKWMVEDLDLVSCYRYYRDGKLGLGEWLHSFRGLEEGAFICGDDPLPVAAMLASRTGELLKRLFRAVSGKAQRTSCTPSRPIDGFVRPGFSSRPPIFNSLNRRTGP